MLYLRPFISIFWSAENYLWAMAKKFENHRSKPKIDSKMKDTIINFGWVVLQYPVYLSDSSFQLSLILVTTCTSNKWKR